MYLVQEYSEDNVVSETRQAVQDGHFYDETGGTGLRKAVSCQEHELNGRTYANRSSMTVESDL